ncbi:MAG: response regulator transcription factor [Kiritimatiellae bacterium]|nr:response regulator transcription factor [Kiritimatiellia bacterium]
MNRKIKVLIADDHAVVRMGLASLLTSEKDLVVVGQCEDGESAVIEADRLLPDVIVMDLVMPKKDGVVATDEIHRAHPEIRIILLTTFGTSDRIARALEVGASGALLKSADESLLIDAIRSVAAGREFIDEDIRQLFADDPPARELTTRQRTILEALAAGKGTKEIATELNIKADSVREHILAILTKLGAANRVEAIAIAYRKHLLKT